MVKMHNHISKSKLMCFLWMFNIKIIPHFVCFKSFHENFSLSLLISLSCFLTISFSLEIEFFSDSNEISSFLYIFYFVFYSIFISKCKFSLKYKFMVIYLHMIDYIHFKINFIYPNLDIWWLVEVIFIFTIMIDHSFRFVIFESYMQQFIMIFVQI